MFNKFVIITIKIPQSVMQYYISMIAILVFNIQSCITHYAIWTRPDETSAS